MWRHEHQIIRQLIAAYAATIYRRMALAVMAICPLWLAGESVASADEGTPITNPRQSFLEAWKAWKKWQEEATGAFPLCEVKSVIRPETSNRAPRVSQVGWEENYFYRHVARTTPSGSQELVVIANPRYAAAISRQGSGKWRVMTIAPRDEVANNPQLSTFLMTGPTEHVLSPLPFIKELLASGRYRVTKAVRLAAEDGAGGGIRQRFTLEPRSDDETLVKRLVITVAEDYGLLPVEFSVTQAVNPKLQPGEDTTDVFQIEWRKHGDVWKWSRAGWIGDDSSTEFTWTIPSPERRLDRKWCYLSHYGLPEPEFKVARRSWTWLVIGFVALAGGVLVVVYRFKR